MDFAWTKHRFSGGLLAFDLANTVVNRHDPVRRQDRLAIKKNIKPFVEAALEFRRHEFTGGEVKAPDNAKEIEDLLHLREKIDEFVRPCLKSGVASSEAIVRLFAAAAKVGRDAKKSAEKLPFGYFVSLSAMRLLDPQLMQRCKVCPQCSWLFVDRSKNRSRVWCDMAVCGNRTKAKFHYERQVTQQRQPSTVEPLCD